MTEEQSQDQPEQSESQAEDQSAVPTEDQSASGAQAESQPDPQKEGQAEELPNEDEEPQEPQDAPPGYEPQVQLAPGQTGEMTERPGEQVDDVEAAESNLELSARNNDDEAVDDSESGDPE